MVEAGKKPPTIQDVARRAGVSAATVSRVLSTPLRVSEETKMRVDAAIAETGYTVNQSARSLRMQKAKTILAHVPGIGNMFYSMILAAVVAEASARGYGVLVTSRDEDYSPSWLSRFFQSNQVDGLLVFDGALDTKGLHSITGNDAVPLVASYDEIPDPQINSVITDNLEAAERAVNHLYDLGHRDIGIIMGLSRNTFPHERLVGFRKAMFEHNLPVREEWMFPGNYTVESGRRAAKHFMGLEKMPTAIFAANDEMAMGLMSGLRDEGIHCPRDISVVGFDDSTVAQSYAPTLTTLRQPTADIGRLATKALIDLIEGDLKSGDPVRIVLKSELVVRESTASPASG